MKKIRFVFLLLLMLIPLGAYAQQQMIKGRILDEKGETIIGASVAVKGTADGGITNMDGEFAVVGKKGDVITISYIGYSPLSVKITKLVGNVFVLKEDSELMEEVVVVGMDKQKRNTITAAVATVGSDAIVNRPVTDLTSALQGNVAGLNFASDAAPDGVGGETGAEIKFNIRGIGSINGGEPYVLVDGVEQSMQNVNPADIESISVLKDASAAAVYGARAAYGVVLVTTKSGRKEKTRVTYRGTVGFSSPINMPKLMNSLEFADYVNERCDNMGVKHKISDGLIKKMQGFIANPYSEKFPGIDPNQNKTDWASSMDAVYANTDWFDYYFKDAAIRHSHNLSVMGGSEKINFYVGLGYTYQEGLLDQVDDNLSKYNMNTKFQITANKWLKFNLNNNITLNILKRPMANQTIFYGTLGQTIPNAPTHYRQVTSEYNDASEFRYMKESHYVENYISDAMSFSATVTPLEGWDIIGEMKMRFDIKDNNFKRGFPKYEKPDGELSVITGTKQGYVYPGMEWKKSQWGSYTHGNTFNYYLSPNVLSSYTHQWGEHFFKAMAGFQMELQENSNGYTYKDGILSEDIFSFANANGSLYAGEERTHWATMGVYTRMNYNYQNVYFLEFSGRYDGSSRFAPSNRWGFFPSFSAGYDMARTDYFKAWNLPFSQLKVRVSYGRLGNQNGAGLYDYLGIMNVVSDSSNAWLLPGVNAAPSQGLLAKTPKMTSPYITWEKVDNANLGIDLMLLNNRLSVTADIYQRTTHDMIGPAEAIPAIGGINADDRAKVNNATLRNRGWELSVHWQDNLKCGFSYGIGFNVFNYKAIVTKYNNPEGLIFNNHTGLQRNKGYYEGMDIGEIWGYKADDLFMTNREVDEYLKTVDLSFFKSDNLWQRGDLKFVDSNGDHKVDPGKGTLSDHGDLKIIGNTTPKYSFGINLNAGYKGFEVSALFQGVAKRQFPMAGAAYLYGGNSYFKEHLDHFSPNNPDGYLPRLTENNTKDYEVNVGYNTSRYLLNAAYMRLKNLTVSYSFKPQVLKNIGLSDLKVYFTCDNLFTISSLPKQFDPETLNQVNGWVGGSNASAPALTSPLTANGNGRVYPLNQNFVFGIDIAF